jgi:ABC-type polar amino acid transport system ATPase subunit
MQNTILTLDQTCSGLGPVRTTTIMSHLQRFSQTCYSYIFMQLHTNVMNIQFTKNKFPIKFQTFRLFNLMTIFPAFS